MLTDAPLTEGAVLTLLLTVSVCWLLAWFVGNRILLALSVGRARAWVAGRPYPVDGYFEALGTAACSGVWVQVILGQPLRWAGSLRDAVVATSLFADVARVQPGQLVVSYSYSGCDRREARDFHAWFERLDREVLATVHRDSVIMQVNVSARE